MTLASKTREIARNGIKNTDRLTNGLKICNVPKKAASLVLNQFIKVPTLEMSK